MASAQLTVSLVTAPPDAARRIASAIVERRLAACVNVVPAIHSVYRWEGQVRTDEEALLVVKGTRETLSGLEALLGEIHPYDVYELVTLDIAGGSAPYLDWLVASTAAPAVERDPE